jgi:hypothetical protein
MARSQQALLPRVAVVGLGFFLAALVHGLLDQRGGVKKVQDLRHNALDDGHNYL